MLFSSEKQLIFKVRIGGTAERLVVFGESHPGDPSTFQTNDASVIAAIRRHRFYKDGKIRESGKEPEPIKHEELTINNGQAATPINNDPLKVNNEEPETVLTFSNFSQAKSYFKKTYGVEAKSLKTPHDVTSFAKSKGVVYEIKS